MNRLFLLQLLITTCLASCSQNEKPRQRVRSRTDAAYRTFMEAKAVADTDEKLKLLSKAAKEIDSPEDTLLTEILDYQIYYHDLNKAYDSSLYYADQMIERAEKAGDTAMLAKGYYRRGRINLYRNDHLGVLQDMFRSKKYYLLVKDSINAGKRLVELGIAQLRLGDLSGSQESQVQALRLLENSDDSVFLASIHNNLATSYRKLDDADEAIDEYENALRLVSSRHDSLMILNNIANIYREKKEYQNSLRIFDSILPLAADLRLLNRIKDNYYFTHWLHSGANIEDSLKFIMESRQRSNDLTGLLSSYDHLIRINMEEDPKEALEYARDYYDVSREVKSIPDEVKSLAYLIQLSPPGENKKYSLEYIHLNDSLLAARSRVKNLFAKIRYDEEQKLEEITELERLTSNQRLELLHKRNQRNIAISAGILLLGVGFFVYYFLKQRHKKEKLREVHNTEARIAKRIHDELANDVYNVMTQLENSEGQGREDTLNKLESIYSRTRNISRENTPVNTGASFRDDLQYMLSHSTPRHSRIFLTGFQDISWEEINPEAKVIIYRVLQELMVNMNKHSQATIISLNFSKKASELRITYNDNGVGTSTEHLKNGCGLENVENRIVSIGGTFNFHPGKENGFSANILVPV